MSPIQRYMSGRRDQGAAKSNLLDASNEGNAMYRIVWLRSALALAAATAMSAPALAQDEDEGASSSASSTEIEIATGADYSVGKYGGTSDIKVWSIPLDLKVRSGRFRAQASLPYVFIDGNGQLVGGVVVSDPQRPTGGGGGGGSTSHSGLGDLTLTAGYTLNSEAGALPSFELSGSVKLPTAKDTIGTGKTDETVSLSAYKTVGQGVMLFATIGYSWLGSPATYPLKDGIMASGGLNYRPSDTQNWGVSVAYREPVATGYKGQAVVSPYMTYRVSRRFGLTLYGVAGLNDSSPRYGGGLRLSIFQ